MLESDQDNKEVGTGYTMYQKANAGQVYASMKRSQIFDMARGTTMAMNI